MRNLETEGLRLMVASGVFGVSMGVPLCVLFSLTFLAGQRFSVLQDALAMALMAVLTVVTVLSLAGALLWLVGRVKAAKHEEEDL